MALWRSRLTLGTDDEADVISRVWADMQPTSIDYGIMEGARRSVMFSADKLDWLDVGDWGRLHHLADHDQHGNAVRAGNVLLAESSGNFVLEGKDSKPGRLIVLHGVKDIVLVDTGDVLLLVNRDQAGDVKDIVEKLRRDGLERYL